MVEEFGFGPWMVWIDGFGGVWVSPSPRVSVGTAWAGKSHHLAIVGDLLPYHASVLREGDWYIMAAEGPVSVNGKPVDGYHIISPDDVAELGGGVRMRFSWPQPLSNSVRVEVLSGHPTLPRAEVVILIDSMCLLGPTSDCHVVVPHWSSQVALLNRSGQLWIHCKDKLLVAGREVSGRGVIQPPCRVRGREISFFIEPLGQ